jgi:hypothetical protein
MRVNTATLLKTLSYASIAVALWLGLGDSAQAGSRTIFCLPGQVLKQGYCVPLGKAPDAFSGAALASQAVSELSETTTQENTRSTLKKIGDRREEEKARCAEGFTRVNGVCQPITPPVPEKVTVVAPPSSPKAKKMKKPKGAAIRPEKEQVPAAKVVRRERLVPVLPPPAIAPPPAMVCKDQPCAPIPIEPAVRYASWAQIFGDYEHRDATGIAVSPLSVVPTITTTTAVQSNTATGGFQAGADLTTRGVLYADDGLITGVMAGFAYSSLTLNVQSLSIPDFVASSSHTNARLFGPTVGLYATYFTGAFSTDFLLKADILTLNEGFADFGPGVTTGGGLPRNAGSSVGLINTTAAGDLNYRFDLYPNFWVEPTVGTQIVGAFYQSGAEQLGLHNGSLVMVQGGARFGTTTLINDRILMTTVLTGLAYDDVVVTGNILHAEADIIHQQAFASGNNILENADRGEVRGRGILAFNFDFGQGVSSFIQGDVRGGKGLFGAGGKAGIRYVW